MATKLIRPYFLEDNNGETCTVNSHRYRNVNQTFLVPEIQDNDGLWFQQDGATVHTVVISMTALRNLFPGRLNSRFGDVTWLLHSRPNRLFLVGPSKAQSIREQTIKHCRVKKSNLKGDKWGTASYVTSSYVRLPTPNPSVHWKWWWTSNRHYI